MLRSLSWEARNVVIFEDRGLRRKGMPLVMVQESIKTSPRVVDSNLPATLCLCGVRMRLVDAFSMANFCAISLVKHAKVRRSSQERTRISMASGKVIQKPILWPVSLRIVPSLRVHLCARATDVVLACKPLRCPGAVRFAWDADYGPPDHLSTSNVSL